MRLVKRLQRWLREARVEFGPGDEIDEMGRILESAPGMGTVFERVLKDVTDNGQSRVGREGLPDVYQFSAISSHSTHSARFFSHFHHAGGVAKVPGLGHGATSY